MLTRKNIENKTNYVTNLDNGTTLRYEKGGKIIVTFSNYFTTKEYQQEKSILINNYFDRFISFYYMDYIKNEKENQTEYEYFFKLSTPMQVVKDLAVKLFYFMQSPCF